MDSDVSYVFLVSAFEICIRFWLKAQLYIWSYWITERGPHQLVSFFNLGRVRVGPFVTQSRVNLFFSE